MEEESENMSISIINYIMNANIVGF